MVAGGTVLALDRSGTSAPVAPTTTEQAPTATAAPTPSTTPSTTPPVSSETAPGAVVPTAVPAGFLLPHEGEQSQDPDVTDWAELPEALSLPACEEGLANIDLPIDTPPTDERWIGQNGPEYSRTIGLQVFASADDAAGNLAALTALAEDCLRLRSGGSPITVAEDLPGSWGQGSLWVESYRAEGAETGDDFGLGGTYTLAVRVGNAIAVSQGYGEVAPAVDGPDAEVVADLRGPLDQLAPRLCVFTAAGC